MQNHITPYCSIEFCRFDEYAGTVCVRACYLSWSCWTEIVHNAEQSALASLPGDLRFSFGTCACLLRAALICLLCAWDIVPNNWIGMKGWRVWCISSPSSHFYSWPFSALLPPCLLLQPWTLWVRSEGRWPCCMICSLHSCRRAATVRLVRSLR